MSIQFKQSQKTNLAAYHGQPKSNYPRFRWTLMVILLSAPLLYILYQILINTLFISFTGFVSFTTLTIRAPQTGYIENIYVKENEEIPAGTVLLQFKSPELDVKLRDLYQEKSTLKAMSQNIKVGTPELNKEMLAHAQENINNTKAIFERFKKFAETGHLLVLQLEEARRNYFMAQQNFDSINKTIADQNTTETVNMEVNYFRKLREIEDKIGQLQELKKQFKIITHQPVSVMNLTTYENEFVSSGQPLLTLVTHKNLQITAYIDPKYLDKIHKGRKVSIQFPNGDKEKGYIASEPGYAEITPMNETNPLSTRQNKLVVIIKTNKGIPPEYQIHGIPVKISFRSWFF